MPLLWALFVERGCVLNYTITDELMERKIVLRKGPFRKILHLTGRKVVTHDYFPRPIIAEKAYQEMRDTWINKRGWSVEVKQKEKRIILPSTEGAEILPANNVMGLKTNFR